MRALPARLLLPLLLGCGASHAGTPTTPAGRELVIDEPTVVRAHPSPRPGELPPLPLPLSSYPDVFQRGHALATALLAAEGPGTPPSEDAAHAQWTKERFEPWLAARTASLQATVDALAPVTFGAPHEQVVAAALIGLAYARLHDALVAVPPPTSVAADAKLARVYQSALHAQAQAALEQGSAALAACAQTSSAQTDAAYGLWLQLCTRERAVLVQAAAQARTLAELVRAERDADRIAAEGPRPPGPEVCWTGMTGGYEVTTTVSTDVQTGRCTTTSARSGPLAWNDCGRTCDDAGRAAPAATSPDESRAAPAPSGRCACDATSPWNDGSAVALSPRDLRYGLRDAATSVRVSATLVDEGDQTMDGEPLLQPATRSALAACFARHVPSEPAVTVAVHARLSVDARGKTRSATLTTEPSEQAAPPSHALSSCLQRALLKVPFPCSPSGHDTQVRATFCLRRD